MSRKIRPMYSALLAALVALAAGCSQKRVVVVYTSQDEEFALPIFQDFTKQTGIEVKTVYDSEAVKTVGLVNRLLTEKDHPQCDVFWNNEEFRSRELASRGVFRETNGWAGLGYRTRRLVINTNLLSLDKAPKTFDEVTNQIWKGKVALAYPMFGTTSTHFLALRQRWGDTAWQTWCRALVANKPHLEEGNSFAVKLVGRGEAWIGLTDSDDIAGEQREGLPVVAIPVSAETLYLPNTVGVIRNAPHPEEAEIFYEYLKQKDVSQRLVNVHALEGSTLDPNRPEPGLKVDWDGLLRDLDAGTAEMKEIFLR